MTAPVANGDRPARRSVVPPRSEAIPPDAMDLAVQDGDVLLWRGTYMISRAFEALSRSWYSHVAFVVHWEGHPMVLQAGAFGIQAVPFRETVEKYHGLVDWYRLQDSARQQLNIQKMIHEATCNLGLPFGLSNALRELFYRGTGISLFPETSKRRSGMFCAEYVSKCFKSGGLDLVPHKDDIHTFPNDIAFSGPFLFFTTIFDARRRQTAPPVAVPVPRIADDGIVIPGGIPRLPIETTAPATPAAGPVVAPKAPAA